MAVTRSSHTTDNDPQPGQSQTEAPTQPDNSPTPSNIDEQLRAAREMRDKYAELERLKQQIRELHSKGQTAAADEDEQPAKRRRKEGKAPRCKDPDRYKGRSLKELEKFLRQCKNVRRLESYRFEDESEEVKWAISFLDDEPAETWDRYEKDTFEENEGVFTWEEFEDFLRDQQSDPVNRGLTAAQNYAEAKQREYQTARQFATYLEELEAYLPPYDEAQRAQHLFTKLKPSLRKDILGKGDAPTTRRELLALCQRFEGIAKIERRDKDRRESDNHLRSKPADKPARGGHRFRPQRWQNTDQAKSNDNPNNIPMGKPQDKSNVECYACHKKGHYAFECRSRPQPAGKEKTGS